MPHADVNGITLNYNTAGPEDGPAVLLVMGLGAQMNLWPPHLIDPLVQAGIRVIRYDNRDVGESTWFDNVPAVGLAEMFGALQSGTPLPPPYTLGDMAADGIGLLDHLGVKAADIVGASMGGMIVQRMALSAPDRVRSLTSIMSTTGDPGLPGPTPAATEALLTPAPMSDKDAYIQAMIEKREILGSPGFEQDQDWVRSVIEEGYQRGLNPAGFLRQYHAILSDGDRTGALAGLDVPTLVVHGRDDPLIRVQAGEATAAAIPGATLQVVDGMGHDLPPEVCRRLAGWVTDLVGS